MEPQVKYARTSDGVNIAYYTMGSGPPFLWLTMPQSHLLAERRAAPIRDALDGTSRFFTLVRLDPRGFGLSDREVTDFSLDCMVRDVEAVVEKETLGPMVTLGVGIASFTAIAYAARHPENVSHLILLATAWAGRELRDAFIERLTDLAELDWDLASETLVRSFYGREGDPTVDDSLAAVLRESVNPRQLQAIGRQLQVVDVSGQLARLSMPALILHDRRDRHANAPAARRVAADIPDGRLVEIDTAAGSAPAIAQFLASTGGPQPRRPQDAPLPQGTAIILFLDVAGSTELTTQLGDAAYREKERQLDGALRQVIRESGGAPVEGKVLGDGVMATFASAKDAIDAAIECSQRGRHAGLPLHAGIHAGDVLREGNNVHGGAVQVAARIADASAAGEVLVSDIVRGLARTSAGVSFEDRGERELRGVSEPVRVFAVRGE
jgi:class 3 adenylate cyclase